MKTRLSLPILLFFAIFVSTSIQQVQNPTCEPASSSSQYSDTLFVFLVESYGRKSEGIRYLMKQVACTIPEAGNLKTYILDYTDDAATLSITESDLSTSKQLMTKISSTMKSNEADMSTKCQRMDEVKKKFVKLPAVQNKNVKYIDLSMTNLCPHPAGLTNVMSTDTREISKNGKHWYVLLDSEGAGLFGINEVNAPQFLNAAARRIVGGFLGIDLTAHAASAASSSSNSGGPSDCDFFKYAFIVASALVVILLFAFVVYIIWTRSKMKKVMKDEENKPPSSAPSTGDKKKKPKGEGIRELTKEEEDGLVPRPGDSAYTEPKTS